MSLVHHTPARRAELAFLTLSALLLPTLSLLPLGGMYLWEKGWLLPWALMAFALVGLVSFIQWLALRRPAAVTSEVETPSGPLEASGADPAWSAAERRAWQDVRALADRSDPSVVSDPEAAWDLANATIDTVSRRLYPNHEHAVWQFTVPEALAISERVSRRLSRFVANNVPFGDRLTAAQIIQIYRARSLVDMAGRAYDIWRILRLANPATAVTHEMRERLTKALMSWGHEQISRRLVETYVEEIGRAAIDLYGGRLRPTPRVPATPAENPAPADGPLSRVPLHRQVRNAASVLWSNVRKKADKSGP